MDIYRFALGSTIVLGLITLAVAIALGKVEEKTSFGLTAILAILAKVALDFSEWAFRAPPSQAPPTEDPQAKRNT